MNYENINISDFNKGIYFIEIKGDSFSAIEKLSVQ